MRILVADENATHRDGAVRALQQAGHETVVATTGLEAWNLAHGGALDAAFVSASLPLIDGLALISVWRQEHRALPFPVVLTADAAGAAVVRMWGQLLAQSDNPEMLVRPFSPALLPDVVAALRPAQP